MEKVRLSPLGRYVIPKMEQYEKIIPSKLSIDKILSNLNDNRYGSIDEWYNDVRICTSEIARTCGIDSRFGVSVQTLLQLYEDEIASNDPSSQWSETVFRLNCNRIISSFDRIVEDAPNSPNEASDFIKHKLEILPINMYKINPDKIPRFDQEEAADLFHDLDRINSDEEIKKILRTVANFERIFLKAKTYIDVTKLSPFTMSLLKKQLQNGYIKH